MFNQLYKLFKTTRLSRQLVKVWNMVTRHRTEQQRLDDVERDIQNHARILSIFTDDLRESKILNQQLATDKRVREVTDKNLDDRLVRIEKSIMDLTTAVEKRFAPWSSAIKMVGIVAAGVLISAFVRWVLSGVLMP